MAVLAFNARFTPVSCIQVDDVEFDVIADIFDGLGMFSALDVAVNDLVFLDCFVSITAPGTINKYIVTQLHSATVGTVNCRIMWADSGTIVSPDEVVGTAGFVSRPTVNRGLAFHASPTIHTIPDYVTQYSRNIESQEVIDPFFYKYVKNDTGLIIPQYYVVAWENNGTVGLATAAVHSLSDIAGITNRPIPNGEFGWVIKMGYVPNCLQSLNPTPGSTVFLSTTPGRMTLVGPTSLTDTIIKIGRAEPPNGIATPNAWDLHLEMEIIAEP